MSADTATTSITTEIDTRTITLKSSDEKTFQVTRNQLRQIGTLDEMFRNFGHDDDKEKPIEVFPCQKVDGATLELVVKFCEHHEKDKEPTEEELKRDKRSIPLPQWDRELMPRTEDGLEALYVASNYLHVQKLMDACAQFIAGMIQGKSTVEIGKILGIECDLTPQEQETIRKENAWCED